MDPIEQPGYRPEFLNATNWNQLSFEQQMRVIAANPSFEIPEAEPQDIDRAPELEFGNGFGSRRPPRSKKDPSYGVALLQQEGIIPPAGVGPEDIDWDDAPDLEYRSPKSEIGRETETAPMTQEQMRVLLAHVLPEELLPFVLHNVVFDFASTEGPDDPVAAVRVGPHGGKDGSVRDKIHIVFNKSAFVTRGTPKSLELNVFEKQSTIKFWKGRQAKTITGFHDPSKVALIIGRVLGMAIPPPEDPGDQLPAEFKLLHDEAKQHGYRISRDEEGEGTADESRQRQWEEFVALAITAPEMARANSQTYAYFQKASQELLDVENCQKAVERIQGKGSIAIDNFQMVDLRSDAEKASAKKKFNPDGPGGYWFDHVFTGANRFLKKASIFGWKLRIVYELPEDPARMATLAEDAAEVKKYLENYRQEDREKIFGRVMRQARTDNPEDRAKARRLILASCESEDWNEWREIAYLYKFSKKFRESDGQTIDKSDYLDLRMFHNTSSQRGKRFGSDMMPYSAVMANDKDEVTGRQIFKYTRKSKEAYYASVQGKIDEKSDRELQSVGRSVFDVFDHSESGRIKPENLRKIYSMTPEGMDNTYGRLDKLLGADLARTIVTKYLEPLGVEQIPPDSLYVLERLKRIGTAPGGKGMDGEHMPGPAKELIPHFGSLLDRPPAKVLNEWLEGTHHLSDKASAAEVTSHINKGENLKLLILSQIKGIASANAPGTDKPLLPRHAEESLLEAIALGNYDHDKILDYVTARFPEFKPPPGTPLAELPALRDKHIASLLQARANLIVVLDRLGKGTDGQDTLTLYGKIAERVKAITPDSLGAIENAADALTPEAAIGDEPAATVPTTSEDGSDDELVQKQKAYKASLSALEKAGIVDLEERTKRLEARQAKIEATVRAEKMPTGQSFTEEQAKEKEAEIAAEVARQCRTELPTESSRYLADAFSKASRESKAAIVESKVAAAVTGTNSLESYIKRAGFAPDYEAVYSQWESGPGAIFRLPPLAGIRQRLRQATMQMNNSITSDEGIRNLSATLRDIERSLVYSKAKTAGDKKKEAKPAKKPSKDDDDD